MSALAQERLCPDSFLAVVDAGGYFKPLRDNTSRCPGEVTTHALISLFERRPWLRDLECAALPLALLDAAVMGA